LLVILDKSVGKILGASCPKQLQDNAVGKVDVTKTDIVRLRKQVHLDNV